MEAMGQMIIRGADASVFIDPADAGGGPGHELLGLEPEVDLLLGGLDGV